MVLGASLHIHDAPRVSVALSLSASRCSTANNSGRRSGLRFVRSCPESNLPHGLALIHTSVDASSTGDSKEPSRLDATATRLRNVIVRTPLCYVEGITPSQEAAGDSTRIRFLEALALSIVDELLPRRYLQQQYRRKGMSDDTREIFVGRLEDQGNGRCALRGGGEVLTCAMGGTGTGKTHFILGSSLPTCLASDGQHVDSHGHGLFFTVLQQVLSASNASLEVEVAMSVVWLQDRTSPATPYKYRMESMDLIAGAWDAYECDASANGAENFAAKGSPTGCFMDDWADIPAAQYVRCTSAEQAEQILGMAVSRTGIWEPLRDRATTSENVPGPHREADVVRPKAGISASHLLVTLLVRSRLPAMCEGMTDAKSAAGSHYMGIWKLWDVAGPTVTSCSAVPQMGVARTHVALARLGRAQVEGAHATQFSCAENVVDKDPVANFIRASLRDSCSKFVILAAMRYDGIMDFINQDVLEAASGWAIVAESQRNGERDSSFTSLARSRRSFENAMAGTRVLDAYTIAPSECSGYLERSVLASAVPEIDGASGRGLPAAYVPHVGADQVSDKVATLLRINATTAENEWNNSVQQAERVAPAAGMHPEQLNGCHTPTRAFAFNSASKSPIVCSKGSPLIPDTTSITSPLEPRRLVSLGPPSLERTEQPVDHRRQCTDEYRGSNAMCNTTPYTMRPMATEDPRSAAAVATQPFPSTTEADKVCRSSEPDAHRSLCDISTAAQPWTAVTASQSFQQHLLPFLNQFRHKLDRIQRASIASETREASTLTRLSTLMEANTCVLQTLLGVVTAGGTVRRTGGAEEVTGRCVLATIWSPEDIDPLCAAPGPLPLQESRWPQCEHASSSTTAIESDDCSTTLHGYSQPLQPLNSEGPCSSFGSAVLHSFLHAERRVLALERELLAIRKEFTDASATARSPTEVLTELLQEMKSLQERFGDVNADLQAALEKSYRERESLARENMELFARATALQRALEEAYVSSMQVNESYRSTCHATSSAGHGSTVMERYPHLSNEESALPACGMELQSTHHKAASLCGAQVLSTASPATPGCGSYQTERPPGCHADGTPSSPVQDAQSVDMGILASKLAFLLSNATLCSSRTQPPDSAEGGASIPYVVCVRSAPSGQEATATSHPSHLAGQRLEAVSPAVTSYYQHGTQPVWPACGMACSSSPVASPPEGRCTQTGNASERSPEQIAPVHDAFRSRDTLFNGLAACSGSGGGPIIRKRCASPAALTEELTPVCRTPALAPCDGYHAGEKQNSQEATHYLPDCELQLITTGETCSARDTLHAGALGLRGAGATTSQVGASGKESSGTFCKPSYETDHKEEHRLMDHIEYKDRFEKGRLYGSLEQMQHASVTVEARPCSSSDKVCTYLDTVLFS